MKLFEVTVHILQTIVSWLLFTIVFFGKMKKKLTKPFTQFSHFEKKCTFRKRTRFENECTFRKRTTFWKWMHISKKELILRMNTHFEKELHFENECTFRKRTHFENQCTFRKRTTFWKWKCVFGKVKVINHFLKKLQLANSLKKVSRVFVGAKFDWLVSSNPEFLPSES